MASSPPGAHPGRRQLLPRGQHGPDGPEHQVEVLVAELVHGGAHNGQRLAQRQEQEARGHERQGHLIGQVIEVHAIDHARHVERARGGHDGDNVQRVAHSDPRGANRSHEPLHEPEGEPEEQRYEH